MLLMKQFCICDFCHNKIEIAVILLMEYTDGYIGSVAQIQVVIIRIGLTGLQLSRVLRLNPYYCNNRYF